MQIKYREIYIRIKQYKQINIYPKIIAKNKNIKQIY